MKKWICRILALVMVFSLAACGSREQSTSGEIQEDSDEVTLEEETEPTEDELEAIKQQQAQVEWNLDENGVLTISGTGAMPDYAMASADTDIGITVDAPWFDRRLEVTSLVIEEGITYVGEWAFSALENMTQVSFPTSLIGFGMGSMGGNGLTELVIPDIDWQQQIRSSAAQRPELWGRGACEADLQQGL